MALGDTRKDKFIIDMLLFVKAIAPWCDISDELYQEYWNNGYDSGGADPIVDADCAPFDIPAQTITDFITFLNDFNRWKNGVSSVALTEYVVTINKVRYAVAPNEQPTPKGQYIAQLCHMVEGILEWIDRGPYIYKVYWNNGFNTTIDQLSLDPHLVDLADFTNGITMLENWNKVYAGQGSAVINFAAVINTLRRAII